MATWKSGGRVFTWQVQGEDAQQEAEETQEQNISQDEYVDEYNESEHKSEVSDTESTAENVSVEFSFLSQGTRSGRRENEQAIHMFRFNGRNLITVNSL